VSRLVETHAIAEPRRDSDFVDFVRRHREHRGLCLVDIWWIGIPDPVVEIDEQKECGPGGALAAVGKRIVPGEVGGEDRCLVEEVGVELLSAEAGLRRLER
jgi:hypothetical protein